MKTFKLLFIALMLCTGPYLHAQSWDTFGNFVSPGDFIGSTNDEFFDVRQNNIRRARFRNVTWPGYNGSPATPNASRMHFGINGNDQVPFSMMHLGDATPAGLQRPWMNVGTTYGAGADIMHVGLLQRPAGSNNNNIVDAVVAWGCNDDIWFPGAGPDNLRFLFIAPSNAVASPGSAPEGLETMRITPWGNVGIGNAFSNALQPVRKLDVFDNTNAPQFRLSQSLSADINLGNKADFQTSNLGNLHIRTSSGSDRRTVAIGFLPGEASDPINTGALQTRLDVGGLTRIRELRFQQPNCLITGVNVGPSSMDNFLTRLDFIKGDTADCYVLGGGGNWIEVCDNGLGPDKDWEFDNLNVWTGHGLNGFPAGVVGIGVQPSGIGVAKLHVRATSQNQNFLGSKAILAETVPVAGNFLSTAIELSPRGGTVVNWGTQMSLPAVTGGGTYGHSVIMTSSENAALWGFQAVLNGQLSNATAINYGGEFNVKGGVNSQGTCGLVASAEGGLQAIGVNSAAPINSGINYAGFFNGDVWYTGSIQAPSDESLKSEIQPLENATEKLLQLQPKSYVYMEGHPRLNLPSGSQFGLIAQEVESVLPDLVNDVHIPARFDSLGNPIEEVLIVKSMRYNDLITLLIQGFQEQQQTIQGQESLIGSQSAQLEAQQAAFQALTEDLLGKIQNLQEELNLAKLDMNEAKTRMHDCC